MDPVEESAMNDRERENRQSVALIVFYGTHWRWIAVWYAVKDSLRGKLRYQKRKR
jgi:hypothetical protein